ncbi:hypothetical protein IWW37_004048 [Coemansia sp. RSA 2050]|nr:hypothetical protein IWW37_004048 [Coemansia sp. RSA 2050]
MSKSLQRRLQTTVRKSDIRVVTSSRPAVEARRSFQAAQDTGSGDENDICHQRLATWLGVVENYQEFFQSMVAAELDLATVYARIGDILRVPVQESVLLLPTSCDGVQAVTKRLKGFQQLMVEGHCAISQTTKHGAVNTLKQLHAEVQELKNSYSATIHPVYMELAQCKLSIDQRSRLLVATIKAAGDSSSTGKEVVKDPFIINLEVEALLRKRAEIENELFRLAMAQQARILEFEPRFVSRLAETVSGFMSVVSEQHKQLRLCAKRDVRTISRIDGATEWKHFSTTFGDVLAAPQASSGHAQADDYTYDGKGSEWVQVLRQGVVALREQSQLFRSTWQSKYGVVTTRGYFHVFRSQGDVVRGVPETSVFLPRARISMVSAGTLQISSGNKFSRCRIVIQDGAASLDNWRLLMESACFRNTCPVSSVDGGLATPPDSGAEESPVRERRHSTHGLARRSALSKASRRRSLAPHHTDSPLGAAATPTTRGRPFSADVSMLTQTPIALAQLSLTTTYTPTKNIYMQPLDSTPLNALRYAPVTHLSPIMNSRQLASFEAYSPEFSDSPGTSRLENTSAGSSHSNSNPFDTGAVHAPNSLGSSSSSGAPHQAESLFEPSASRDSESGPLPSLPCLLARVPSRSGQEAYLHADERWAPSQQRHFEPSRATRSEAGYAGGLPSHAFSAAEPRRPHQFSSSADYVPSGYGYSSDIWYSDVLSMPDPTQRASSRPRPRPRSMIHEPSFAQGALDPNNPYLGDFIASRPERLSLSSTSQHIVSTRTEAGPFMLQGRLGNPRVVSQPAAIGSASPTLASQVSIGPCVSTPRSSHDSIPEYAFEYELATPDM